LVFALLVNVLVLGEQKPLRRIAEANGVVLEKELAEKRTPIWEPLLKINFLVLVFAYISIIRQCVFCLWLGMMQVGVDKVMPPIQQFIILIKYNAGDNAIECKYVIHRQGYPKPLVTFI